MAKKSRIRPIEISEKRPPAIRAQESFLGYGEASLKKTGPSGPSLYGFRCVASWDVVLDPREVSRFVETATSVGNVVRLFHGTRDHNVSAITKKGLKPGSIFGMFGSGIYLGDVTKAMGYTGYGAVRYVFEVDAALGHVHRADTAHKWTHRELQKKKFHSVQGVADHTRGMSGVLRQNEWCVYSPLQVKVVRLHEYQDIAAMQGLHSCTLLAQKETVEIPRGAKVFEDILRTKVCGERAVVRCSTDRGEVKICNSCLQKQKICIGSKVPIQGQGSRKGLVWARIESVRSLI